MNEWLGEKKQTHFNLYRAAYCASEMGLALLDVADDSPFSEVIAYLQHVGPLIVSWMNCLSLRGGPGNQDAIILSKPIQINVGEIDMTLETLERKTNTCQIDS